MRASKVSEDGDGQSSEVVGMVKADRLRVEISDVGQRRLVVCLVPQFFLDRKKNQIKIGSTQAG